MDIKQFRIDFKEFYEKFGTAVGKIRERLYPNTEKYYDIDFDDYLDYKEQNTINVKFNSSYYGDNDRISVNIPDTVITEEGLEEYINIFIMQQELDREKAKRDKEIQEKKEDKDKEKAEQEEYKRLKEKYETPDTE
jgi:hypothetical protein